MGNRKTAAPALPSPLLLIPCSEYSYLRRSSPLTARDGRVRAPDSTYSSLCIRGPSGRRLAGRGRATASRVSAPCDVPVVDAAHSAGLRWDP